MPTRPKFLSVFTAPTPAAPTSSTAGWGRRGKTLKNFGLVGIGDADKAKFLSVFTAPTPARSAACRCGWGRRGKTLKNFGLVGIAVADNGPGIADADKAKIFERFYRADPSRTDKQHCGLGLAVAQELARLHGAALRVSDTRAAARRSRCSFPGDSQTAAGRLPCRRFFARGFAYRPVLLKRAFPAIIEA